ncbi:AbiEi antitoxin N-terminal domain-containing protein [Luteibacter aegosomaticola]|uniref:type IV toxin-antitoxin system AbiEi family antitoxin domain-containing protein n=1 Tax=Luteibacter aegosomaticola TaxID=2911538 RepID=UPI001FF787D8|nr:type IV toxin-antitoxin system AbiEi family antitoxin domain-containing protein [Luteibacter aegosomaticola]UPG90837.1 AbiEi antitoxin N-terminal domain-containing protein [Luteibacter aegosomaticola]
MPRKIAEDQILALARDVGVIRARDIAARGIPTVVLSRMVAAGQLERVSRGLYTHPGTSPSEHRSLAEVAARIPSGVVCLLTALRYYGIGTQSPLAVWVAIPSQAPTPRLAHVRIRYVWMTPSPLTEGVTEVNIEGVSVKVFSIAKTIADCFKFRNKIGLDVAVEALADAWRRDLVSMDDLWRFAKIDRVANVMRPYLESLTV